MSDVSRDAEDVVAFYDRGLEHGRLAVGTGALEFVRTQVLLERYIPSSPAVVADIGGGPEQTRRASASACTRSARQHRNPMRDPAYFTTAYFHHPAELASEFASAGLVHETTLAIEGPGWLLADLDTRLADEPRRAVLLGVLAAIEAEPALLGVSAHLLAVARRQ